ncbi:amino acid ABC transporter permease [Halomonas sp. McH1-25]|uniref:amino acid ABC transporter permease n=1 Tax=unclassified Halomonas TaxID=2609666 RepID=UPI001EF62AF1|nr:MULTISPECIES: amino acid ABC transporter permease [unclassified Halomonas]MCG7599543.1 amino acid ABC transporter permease [Halomonas sp. McH1-25]MCP1342184.1 amino acid ABC transporter permease [Halomonas sp. FL8]MCP1362776.1 amino acid ABC transporter permease [Halomonas sp. BBD45]MCP1365489.1 amino acid ABC transporter permease [Halomonas sp. BBD48]
MIAAREAPDQRRGVAGWLRANLFSGPINSVVSVITIVILARLLWPFIEWAIVDADWLGSTREDCTGEGACWVFISARFESIVYGFYPEAARWRVDIVFAMLAALIAWLAIPRLPAKRWVGLFALVGFPLVAYYLLVGGHFGLMYVPTREWGGLMLTLTVATVGIVGSLPIGVLLALGRRSSMPLVKGVCVLFIEFWRGVPLITVLFMASVMLPLFVPSEIEFDKLLRALIGIMFFWSAYMAEVVRGGLQAIDKGQNEAGQALGLGYWQRMGLIVLPQALKLVIPGIVNTFIALFKDTSLVLIIGLFDLLAIIRAGLTDTNWLGFATEGYVFAALVFWIFCFSMSRYSQYIERKLHTGHER